ncbi:MAG: 30S ribosomal protein S16 [Bacilli bacterium]|jgi:small subunit ribosomal protein S16|nr:30S ribosomal protein S16 [Bacilli bacterium]MBR1846305.1 30S ribosomal protein S16 [Bacilli bacterium]MDY6391471.1 30S ribosomal protein S16 [Bacilli bacterium]
MSVKIRLTRIGRHKDPFYRIVAADSHFTRDGRYIEQIGTYDPALGTKAAQIDEELALKWLNLGAQPSDSVRAMLSSKGIMAKYAEAKVKGKK